MTITFHIEYYTQEDEELILQGTYTASATEEARAVPFTLPLEQTSPGHWELHWESPLAEDELPHLRYRYALRKRSGEVLRQEWRIDRQLTPLAAQVVSYDTWLDQPPHAYRYTDAVELLLPPQHTSPLTSPAPLSGTEPILEYHVHTPYIPLGAQLALSGAHASLGSWRPEQAIPLEQVGRWTWRARLSVADLSSGSLHELRYKYLLIDAQGQVHWEQGDDRTLQLLPPSSAQHYRIQDGYLRLPLPSPRLAGLAVPLFSLRSERDWGIGDFGALREALDLTHQLGMHALQLLPIHDTTFYRTAADSYPYNAISVHALHPIYMDLDRLPRLRQEELEGHLRRQAEVLRELPRVDYPAVLALKEAYLQALYEETSEQLATDPAYSAFCTEQADWLTPYAWYCVLRDLHPAQPPHLWGEAAHYSPTLAEHLSKEPTYAQRFAYYCWVQYLLDSQLREVRQHGERLQVFLKGDLPIGVAPHGVDVWVAPELFHTQQAAGAPPDAFASAGQNWGFPTYDWERMRQDGYAWWSRRLRHQSTYFHALRIDHILGFFRIWEIPRPQVSGLQGHFHPALPYSLEAWQGLLGDDIDLRSLIEPLDHGQAPSEHRQDYALLRDPYSSGYHPHIAWEKTTTYQQWPKERQARWQAIAHDFFYVRHNELYRQTALQRLGALTQQTALLLCAEDLGMIPASVPAVLEELQILSLELERMPKESTPTGWADPRAFPPRAVATTSTHDMPSLRGWWHALPPESQQRYLWDELQRLDTPEEVEIYRLILQRHLASPALASILPLADWMSSDTRLWLTSPEEEQINHPEDPHQYWNFRFPCSCPALTTLAPEWISRTRDLILHTLRIPFASL